MRVLHVITGLAAGGAEQQLRLLLQRTRHDCAVASLVGGGVIADALARDGVPVRSVGMRSNRQVGALGRLVRLMRQGRYDIVHVHLYRACVYGRIAARLARVPIGVTTEHSLGDDQIENRPKSRGVRALYLATERLTDVTIAPSETVRRRLVDWGVRAERIRRIPIGLDVRAWTFDPAARRRVREELGVGPDVRLVGVVGRLEPVKQVDLAVRALAPLLGPATRLVVVGDGSLRAQLEDLARAQGVDAFTSFLGERLDVPSVLSALDVLVSPSHEETFGLVLLEALGAGLPIVYFTAPALDDLPERPANAIRVTGGVRQLHVAVADVIAEPPQERVVPAAILRHYDIAAVASAVDDLYDQLAAAHQ